MDVQHSANNPGGSKWIRTRDAQRILCISGNTLRKWADNGWITSIPLPGGTQRQFRLYDITSINTAKRGELAAAANSILLTPDISNVPDGRIDIIYARVSTLKQKDDLRRQIEALQV
jgi:predicted site-specific integrase-resolvase